MQNFFGDTVVHLAAAERKKGSLEPYIFQMINFSGDTAIYLDAVKHKKDSSLELLIQIYPHIIDESLADKSVILMNIANDASHTLLIKFSEGNKIHGAEVGISIPGIPDVLSYYYQDQVSLLLKLRLEDAKPGALNSVDVLEASYILQENNSDDVAAKLSSFILASAKETILMPLNIGGSHLVGIAAKKKHGDKVVLHYMDSELNPLPESLFAKVRAELESRVYSTERVIAEIEKQNYSNCGPEVIENLTAFASGKTRTSQEKAIPKHSTLFEEYLLKDSSKGESTDDSSAHESIIKSMPVLSESATILGNMLFYKISRVSDMKKSIELNIANTDLLVDAKTQAQLIYYYNTGELLPSARSMLERNSAAIQEHYKFSIVNETFQVSMPDTLITDGKLEAQVLHYLRSGELFESARSALESGAVRVINQSSTVSEEEVENTVPLIALLPSYIQASNKMSHNDSGEALEFSEEHHTNDTTGGLFDSFLAYLPSFS
ncbi:hypothetical protein [Candidatus Lariskella endosymbiont of Hedychridium roseum]|uniref:hypothetical protein n=1 Tax=Candidatus Lariskella endosymbiont of Hedychridium roseum TaxID=3077949 RepID=UPI0030D35A29